MYNAQQPPHSQPRPPKSSTPSPSNILPNLRPSPPASDVVSHPSVVLPVGNGDGDNKRNGYSTPSWLKAARHATSVPTQAAQISIPQHHVAAFPSSLAPPLGTTPIAAGTATPGDPADDSPVDSPADSSGQSPPQSAPSLPPHRRGRPKGWRPGMSYAEMRGNQPPPNSTATSAVASQRAHRQAKPTHPLLTYKKRGRQPKPPSPPPQYIYRQLKPRFYVFMCEWKGCNAELHNMDTLRRHLQVVHGGGKQCFWRKCTGHETHKNLRVHLEEKHLVPLSWHVGDGPQNKADWKKPLGTPEFLKDRTGKQVTPSTVHQELEDPLTYKENRRKLKELHLRIQENMSTDDDSTD